MKSSGTRHYIQINTLEPLVSVFSDAASVTPSSPPTTSTYTVGAAMVAYTITDFTFTPCTATITYSLKVNGLDAPQKGISWDDASK